MVLCSVLVSVSSASTFRFSNLKSNKIVGGVVSDITKHPYVVSLQRTAGGGHYCGGSLIAPKFVLSAGHCVDFISANRMKVVIGSQSNSANASTAEVHKVVKVTTHPGFINSADKITHDFSVIELETESAFQPVELTSALADPFKVSKDGSSMTLGWGTTTESGSLAKTLMEVSVPLVANDVCAVSYPDQIDETMVCAGLKEGGKDSCQGDSGGPLVTLDADNNEILIGVVSWGEGCARPNKYGVYSNVAFAREWIDGVLALSPEVLLAQSR